MILHKKKIIRRGLIIFSAAVLLAGIGATYAILKTRGRTQIQIDIHQNKKLIYLSTFAEPPQFAIWLEDPKTHELKTVFVTHRVAKGDWEGKANVPVALPQWFMLFKGKKEKGEKSAPGKKSDMAISGATPKADYFSLRVEVEPGSEWICWIEMNLAGDFNDAYPEIDMKTLREDEYSNGQPALIFRADLKAIEDLKFKPSIVAQSVWNKGVVSIEPVSDGITSAKNVFDDIQISVIKPKPKLIDKTKVRDN